MYITFTEYAGLYGNIDEDIFNRLCREACRAMDIHTTGIDNVKKLKVAFPADEDSSETVKYCAAKIINLLYQIHEAETAAALVRGYTETEQGLQRRIISRIESGNEAISYSETKINNTVIDVAVSDRSVRDKLVADVVRECLSGIEDANGVNLLFMGRYPRRYLC